jgi:diguanylate cyclase (GGDEF)-like protein/PAS domain S-box-containing protein
MSESRLLTTTSLVIEGPLPKPPIALARLMPTLEPDLEIDTSLYHDILDSIEDGVYFVDRQKRIRLWNRGAEAITGFSRQEMLGESCGSSWLSHVDASGRFLCTTGCPLRMAVDKGVPIEADAYLQHKLGHRIPVKIRTRPLRNRQNHVVGAVEIFSSTIAGRRQDQLIEEFAHLAMIDDLTKLPNRRHFDMQLDRRLAELNRFGWPFGILMVDIDNFKQVNDGFGHQVGDDVLRLVARTLSANCRTLDTVARWGGEEFSAIITNVREEELQKVAEKFRAMIEASGLRETTNDHLRVTVSVGGAVAQPNETASALMKRVDDMLYVAKRSGRNLVRM